MMLVDKELDGICVHPQDEYFARTIALKSLTDLGDSYLAKGHPYLDFPLSLEDAKSLLPVNRKRELEIELEKFLIDTYEDDFDDEAPDISEFSSIYLKDIFKNFLLNLTGKVISIKRQLYSFKKSMAHNIQKVRSLLKLRNTNVGAKRLFF